MLFTCGPGQRLRTWHIAAERAFGTPEAQTSDVIELLSTEVVAVHHPIAVAFLDGAASSVAVVGCGVQVLPREGPHKTLVRT